MARIQSKTAKAKHEGRKYERMQIIAPLFKKGYSYREIRAEVMSRLNLKTYSLQTVKADVDSLLKEWRDERIDDVDKNIQLELSRIDALVKEAWGAWEKSKEDYKKKRLQQERVPNENAGGDASESATVLVRAVQSTEDVVECGDPRYIDTINKLLTERRKLLGLYAPDKTISVGNTNVTVGKEMTIEDMEKEIKRLQRLEQINGK